MLQANIPKSLKVRRPRESPPQPPGHRLPRPRRLRPMAEEGKGLSPAGHHSVRLPGKELHPAAAGDGRRSGGLDGGGEAK